MSNASILHYGLCFTFADVELKHYILDKTLTPLLVYLCAITIYTTLKRTLYILPNTELYAKVSGHITPGHSPPAFYPLGPLPPRTFTP